MDQGVTSLTGTARILSQHLKNNLEQMAAFVVSGRRSRCPSRQAGILLVTPPAPVSGCSFDSCSQRAAAHR